MRNDDWPPSTEESTLMSGRGCEDSAKIDVNNLGVKWGVKFEDAGTGCNFGGEVIAIMKLAFRK
jgi:hypothetical protein